MNKKISIIVAAAENNAIGKDNKLLWHIPEDLQRVKELTTGNYIVMGKNTFLSLENGPLRSRTNIVISDDKHDRFQGCVMAYFIEEAIEKMSDEKENFIFGGASIYKQFLPLAQKIYLTRVHDNYEADTFFPKINLYKWVEVEKETNINSAIPHTYYVYEKK